MRLRSAGKIEPTNPDPAKRPATVDDMIKWLWQDGFYRGEVGWSAEWDPEGIFGPQTSKPYVIGMSNKPDNIHQQSKPGDCMGIDARFYKADGGPAQQTREQSDLGGYADIAAGFRESDRDIAYQNYVKKMLKIHKRLLPEALKEIDQQLLRAGVPDAEVKSLTKGRATDAYKKLARLDEGTGKCKPSTRIRFRVMSDLLPGDWMTFDIYLPRNCRLWKFEDAMLRHGLVMDWNQPSATLDARPDEATQTQGNLQSGAEPNVLVKKPGCNRKVWSYKIIEGDNGDVGNKDLEGWKALCDEGDFAEFMQILLTDELKHPKTVFVCHETTLLAGKKEQEKPVENRLNDPEFESFNWDEELDDCDMAESTILNTPLGPCIPIPDDFDWTKVKDGKVTGWEKYFERQN